MKVIRFNLHQDFANYRVFYDFQQAQTYPLPPFSTVNGMLHTLAGLKGYHDTKLFITGSAAGTTTDYQTKYEFGNGKTNISKVGEGKRWLFKKNNTAFTFGPKHIQLLVDVNLTIYVQPQSREDFNAILAGLENPKIYPALGRHEDDAAITNIKVIDLKTTKLTTEYKSNPYINTYMPLDIAKQANIKLESGTKYNIHHHFTYQQVNKTATRRAWTDIPVMYTSQYHVNPGESIKIDPETKQLVALI